MKLCYRISPWLAVAGFFALAAGAPAEPALPNINTNNVIIVTNAPYNAKGDDATDNTSAISDAIAAAAAGGNTNGLLGGTVRIPASGTGIFLCGPLTLQNNVDLEIDTNATLEMEPVNTWINYTPQNQMYANLVYATGATNLEISGSGTIDGQGLLWWTNVSSIVNNRPYMIFFNGTCKRVLIQDVTIQNSPKMHIVFKGSDNDITIHDININTTDSRANQCDGIDLVGSNCLVQHCTINAGDDNIAVGSSSASAVSTDILVTNCQFGVGHGMSIGSNTAGSVSNLTVIGCGFSGTTYGIRMKSDNSTSGGNGEGGVSQNINYYNLKMTNMIDGAIVIYSYYNEYGTPNNITPYVASTQTVGATNIPVWRNIVISNVTATVTSAGVAGIIWGRMEVPATNILLTQVYITASQPFDVYNARGIQFANSQLTLPPGVTNFLLYNAQLIVTNDTPAANLVTLDGLTTNGYANSLALYNASGSLSNTNVLGSGPLSLGSATLAISNNFALTPASVLNFLLGSNAASVLVSSNLTLGGTINVTNGPGFTNGTFVLLTYGKTLGGPLPTLGSSPAGYLCSIVTNTLGQVQLLASLPAPAAPTNLSAFGTNLLILLKWYGVAGVTSYNLKRGTANGGPYPTVFSGLATTNYADAAVTNGVTYYYVVSAVAGGESTNSLQASAVPLPSALPTNIVFQLASGQLQLSWPQDHLGWRLEIQTNSVRQGLGTNWVTVPNSTNHDAESIPVNPANGSVFLRLAYP